MLVNNPREINLKELLHLGVQSTQHSLTTIIVHWTGGNYNQADNDYHLNIDGTGRLYQTCYKLHELKNHTQVKNENSIGIALECGQQATYKDLVHLYYGVYPPTLAQIETAAKAIAILCASLGLVISPQTVKTHYELAVENHYGPNSSSPHKRWDLAKVPKEANLSDFDFGGLVLRARALFYHEQLLERKRMREAATQGPRKTEFVQQALQFSS